MQLREPAVELDQVARLLELHRVRRQRVGATGAVVTRDSLLDLRRAELGHLTARLGQHLAARLGQHLGDRRGEDLEHLDEILEQRDGRVGGRDADHHAEDRVARRGPVGRALVLGLEHVRVLLVRALEYVRGVGVDRRDLVHRAQRLTAELVQAAARAGEHGAGGLDTRQQGLQALRVLRAVGRGRRGGLARDQRRRAALDEPGEALIAHGRGQRAQRLGRGRHASGLRAPGRARAWLRRRAFEWHRS